MPNMLSSPSIAPPSRRVRVLFALSLVVLLAATVILAEAAVRFRQWVKHGDLRTVSDIATVDAATGLPTPSPGMTLGAIRINSLGFRGPELAIPKPEATIRLAFLGASTTFCAEVSSNETTWPHLVWQRLQTAATPAKFDYVNAGVPGWRVSHSLKNLDIRVAPLRPDVIVIYGHANNDLVFDSGELARQQGLATPGRPGEDGWLSRHSLLWSLLHKNLTIMLRQQDVQQSHGKLTYDPRELSRGFEGRLTELVRASQQVASVVAVATFSPRLRRELAPDDQVRASVSAVYYMPWMTIDGMVQGFEEYNRVIRDVARRTGALLIDDENRIPADEIHYNDSIHFTDAGSRVMADRVSDALLATPTFRSLVASRARMTDAR